MDEAAPPSAKPTLPEPGREAISPPTPPRPRENLWANLGFNILLPAGLMMARTQKLLGLSPVPALLIALAFPLGYGLFDLWKRRIWNVISIIGLVGLLCTGGIGLLKLPPEWVALKDGALPLVLGLAVLSTLGGKRSLAQTLLLNPEMMDVARIEAAVAAHGAQEAFRLLLRRATLLVAASFLLHAVLNYFLARHLVKSPAGTPEFTAEIGRMTALSWPLIIIPSGIILMAALFYLMHGVRKLTGLEMEDMFHADVLEKPKKK
jgi:hypothetical protein